MENQQEDGTSFQKIIENSNSAEKPQSHKNWKPIKQEGSKKQWPECMQESGSDYVFQFTLFPIGEDVFSFNIG